VHNIRRSSRPELLSIPPEGTVYLGVTKRKISRLNVIFRFIGAVNNDVSVIIIIIITYSGSQQFCILFQNEFNKDCCLVLPLSISCTFYFPKFHPVAAYLFFLRFPSLLFSFYISFNNALCKWVPTQYWPVQVAFLLFMVCTMFLSFLTLCNILFFARSVQQISPSFSSTTFQNFQAYFHLLSEVSKFQHHNNLCFKRCKFTSLFLEFNSILLMKRIFVSLTAACAMTMLDVISRTQITLDSWNILHYPIVANTNFLSFYHVHFNSTSSFNFRQFTGHVL
jgi:hypothetical protein